VVEGAIALHRNKKAVKLSEQQLIGKFSKFNGFLKFKI
jgi:hypothetical protein